VSDRDYFTVEGTACTIPHRGAKAIYAGDRPRKNEDGTTSYPLRAPLLLMPPEMFENEDEVIAKVARVLNENAHEFFDSAKKPEFGTDYHRMERIAWEAESLTVQVDGERVNVGAVIRALYTDHRRLVAESQS
jgi:hypothetical protein